MALWPDQVFLFVPGFGLLICCTSMLFLIAMRKSLGGGGFYAAMYTLRAMDLLLGLSLFYAAFHGILLSVYGNQNEDMPPLRCLFTALHLHIWVFTDSAQMLLLALLCADQFISVAWTKRHNEFSEYYFNFFPLLFVLLLSAGTLVPACLEPFLLAENDTVRVSSFCAMSDAFGHEFYDAHLTIRKWFPFGGVAILSLTGLVLCLLQLKQQGRFKWSDNNGQSARFFLLGLCRALLLAASVHLPLLQLNFGRTKFNREEKHFLQEISIRIWQAFLFGLLELILELLLLPHFPAKIAEFFNLTEVKRTWQSADDPPAPNRSVGTSGWDIFGSFHSTTGNIIGDAGVPLELNADVQRSVSFYYKDGDD